MDRVWKHCRHCGRPKVNRPRGLCWSCYWTPGVRDLYPSTSKYARRSMRDFYGNHRLPETPTNADPGSEEKLRVMEGRCRLGVSLFHPRDEQIYHMQPVEIHTHHIPPHLRKFPCDGGHGTIGDCNEYP